MRLYIILGGRGEIVALIVCYKSKHSRGSISYQMRTETYQYRTRCSMETYQYRASEPATLYERTICWCQVTGVLAIRLRQGCVDTFESYRDCCIKANRCVAFGIRLRSHTDVCSLQTSPSAPCASSFLQSLDNLASKIVRLLTFATVSYQ